MHSTPKKVRNFILERLEEEDEITGIVLGKEVREQFPAFPLSRFGGLNRFIKQYCRNEVASTREGNIYTYSLRSELATDNFQLSTTQGTQGTVWQGFCNPDNSTPLLVNSITGELFFDASEAPATEGVIQIPTLSSEDYLMIAMEFLPNVEEPLRNELQDSLKQDKDFLPAYLRLLQGNENSLKEWNDWSDRKIIELFKDSLIGTGLSDEVISLALESMERSKAESLLQRSFQSNGDSSLKGIPGSYSKSSTSQDNSRKARGQSSKSTVNLRRILHDVVENMDEEELRNIWVPVGSILDALKKNSS